MRAKVSSSASCDLACEGRESKHIWEKAINAGLGGPLESADVGNRFLYGHISPCEKCWRKWAIREQHER